VYTFIYINSHYSTRQKFSDFHCYRQNFSEFRSALLANVANLADLAQEDRTSLVLSHRSSSYQQVVVVAYSAIMVCNFFENIVCFS
jgi:hypothetical protein